MLTRETRSELKNRRHCVVNSATANNGVQSKTAKLYNISGRYIPRDTKKSQRHRALLYCIAAAGINSESAQNEPMEGCCTYMMLTLGGTNGAKIRKLEKLQLVLKNRMHLVQGAGLHRLVVRSLG